MFNDHDSEMLREMLLFITESRNSFYQCNNCTLFNASCQSNHFNQHATRNHLLAYLSLNAYREIVCVHSLCIFSRVSKVFSTFAQSKRHDP